MSKISHVPVKVCAIGVALYILVGVVPSLIDQNPVWFERSGAVIVLLGLGLAWWDFQKLRVLRDQLVTSEFKVLNKGLQDLYFFTTCKIDINEGAKSSIAEVERFSDPAAVKAAKDVREQLASMNENLVAQIDSTMQTLAMQSDTRISADNALTTERKRGLPYEIALVVSGTIVWAYGSMIMGSFL